jgi:hypothetical protein
MDDGRGKLFYFNGFYIMKGQRVVKVMQFTKSGKLNDKFNSVLYFYLLMWYSFLATKMAFQLF